MCRITDNDTVKGLTGAKDMHININHKSVVAEVFLKKKTFYIILEYSRLTLF